MLCDMTYWWMCVCVGLSSKGGVYVCARARFANCYYCCFCRSMKHRIVRAKKTNKYTPACEESNCFSEIKNTLFLSLSTLPRLDASSRSHCCWKRTRKCKANCISRLTACKATIWGYRWVRNWKICFCCLFIVCLFIYLFMYLMLVVVVGCCCCLLFVAAVVVVGDSSCCWFLLPPLLLLLLIHPFPFSTFSGASRWHANSSGESHQSERLGENTQAFLFCSFFRDSSPIIHTHIHTFTHTHTYMHT